MQEFIWDPNLTIQAFFVSDIKTFPYQKSIKDFIKGHASVNWLAVRTILYSWFDSFSD